MTILEQLAEHARERVTEAKKIKSLDEIIKEAYELPTGTFEFENALRDKKHKGDLAFICECKKASPSKGLIAEYFDYLKIAMEYEKAGADCISVLTEPKWFLGSNDYLKAIASEVKIPCLRKDFTVDEYMIYEAKVLGAKAVLLICSILTKEQLVEYIRICDTLGISALVECHDKNEIQLALECDAKIIGVNNRNLKDFTVDKSNSGNLRKLVDSKVIFVSESGIKEPEDIVTLKKDNVDAVLIGEALMRAEDKTKRLKEFKEAI
jgi:indole-3-glycerol phosphate synthase